MAAMARIGHWCRYSALAGLLAVVGFACAPAPASAGECVDAINRVHGDVLFNRCGECRMAQVSHKRRGGGFPISRTYRVPASGKLELSFAGSGNTRVVGDTPCDGGAASEAAPTSGCAQLGRRTDGSAALVNTCSACRGVVLERTTTAGSTRRQVYTMTARSVLPVALRGTAKLEIVSEIPCPRK